MFKTLYDDMPYIVNKYHRTDEPFNPYNRFAYHGYEYDPATGFDDTQMDEGLSRLNETVKTLPHPVAKATLFAYVLDHARIDVNERDWFVGFYNWGRVLAEYTVYPWDREVFRGLPGVRERMKELDETGAIAIWPDFDHVIPNWDSLLTLGFPGLLTRVEQYHQIHRDKGISPEAEAFFEGIEISYRAILRLLDRYYQLASAKQHAKAHQQAECLRHLRDGAPTTLYEALQAMYLFFILCECVDHYQTRSLGNGIDSTLLPFYESDIRRGASADEENERLAYFFMQFSAIGNYWGHPMYLGGTNADGSTKINRVSYAVLDIYEELRIYNPKVQIKVAENTPKDFLYRVYELIRGGVSSFVFCCEPGHRRALMGYGATAEEARNFELSGCYETRVRGDESSAAAGYVNTAKAIELVFQNGKDLRTGKQIGVRTGNIASLKTFEDFYFAFITQWSGLIEENIRIADAFEEKLDVINPSNVYSATIERALERGVDGYAYGVKFCNSSILNCGFASAVDSLMAVKKMCYDTHTVSLSEMKQALDADWVGYEELRAKARNLPHKYGNGDPETDRFAAALSEYFCHKVNNRPNARGGVYKAVMHSAMQFVWQGEKTAALPDGRKAGEELSKNGSPVSGMDKNGVTALILSACGLFPHRYHESFCLDIMLHPSAVAEEDGLVAMDALLMTYLKNDGMSLQFNVFNAKMLRDAQQHPEKYKNLQVRVCGWNVLWNNLSKAEQDAYICRAENIRA